MTVPEECQWGAAIGVGQIRSADVSEKAKPSGVGPKLEALDLLIRFWMKLVKACHTPCIRDR
jgi:hypothetical protein